MKLLKIIYGLLMDIVHKVAPGPPTLADFCLIHVPKSWNHLRWPLVSAWIFYQRWRMVSLLLLDPYIMKWPKMAYYLLMGILHKVAPCQTRMQWNLAKLVEE
jgi:hypothetical protein